MANEQLSLFGNDTISRLLGELNQQHKAWYYLYKDEQEPEYKVHRYHDGDIYLGVFRKGNTDKESREKILAKGVYLKRNNNGTYCVAHFDREVLENLIDYCSYSTILDLFVNQTELIDDLK